MSDETTVTARDALCMLADMHWVTKLCSSTAEALTVTYSRTIAMASRTVSSAATTSPEMDWMPPISFEICSVAEDSRAAPLPRRSWQPGGASLSW